MERGTWNSPCSCLASLVNSSRKDAESAKAEIAEINEVARQVVDSAFHIHSQLGPGLLESVYQAILAKDLERRGRRVECQKPIPVTFSGLHFNEAFRADIIVDKFVIVEIKSTERLAPLHAKQLLTYLRLMDLRLGLLVNFGAPVIKDGIRRVVNQL